MVEKYPAITVIGDSLFRGVIYDEEKKKYVFSENSLQQILERDLKLDITNYARYGATIAKARSILTGILDDDTSQVVTIEIGNNDADFNWADISQNPEVEHLPRTPLADFRTDLYEMVKAIRTHGKTPVLVTPPPIDPDRYFHWLVKNGLDGDNILKWLGGIKRIYQFHECYSLEVMNCARLLRCPLLNIRQAFLEMWNINDCYCVDGIHLNENGHKIMADVIKENINKLEV
jgi:lysophospholipase L1-like esterase